MKSECKIKDYLELGFGRDARTLELLTILLEYRASDKDQEVGRRLLKELVFRYSAAERELVELNQLKNKFLGIAAHDLRNPLVSIGGFSELLLEGEIGPLNEEQKEFLTIIHSAGRNMLALVNDLLDVSVIESGRLTLKIEPGFLKSLVEDRIRINRMPAEAKEIELHAALEDLPEALFDANRVNQVLDNLIGNAVKFSPPGSNIYITLSRTEKGARISVRDEGPGLSPEDQAKLFGEFQRLSAQPTAGEKSTGLGLAIVRKIVEAHGGTVEVESRLGTGSTFGFIIPLEAAND